METLKRRSEESDRDAGECKKRKQWDAPLAPEDVVVPLFWELSERFYINAYYAPRNAALRELQCVNKTMSF
jgi:hypothetical protein